MPDLSGVLDLVRGLRELGASYVRVPLGASAIEIQFGEPPAATPRAGSEPTAAELEERYMRQALR